MSIDFIKKNSDVPKTQAPIQNNNPDPIIEEHAQVAEEKKQDEIIKPDPAVIMKNVPKPVINYYTFKQTIYENGFEFGKYAIKDQFEKYSSSEDWNKTIQKYFEYSNLDFCMEILDIEPRNWYQDYYNSINVFFYTK